MSLRTRRLPRAPRRSRTVGARAVLLCALTAALLAGGLTEVPASASPAASPAVSPAVGRAVGPAVGKSHGVATAHPKRHDAPQHQKRHPKKHKKHKQKKHRFWSPRDSTIFNYPFSPRQADRFRIRRHVLNAVRYAPGGSRIRLATFTFVDERLTRALIKAHHRGVSVQVLVNRKNIGVSPPFHHLQRVLGHRLRGRPRTTRADASFARTCNRSCRGTGGNLHSKLFLFSQVGHTQWVSMVGSANLNKFAAIGQWNHLNTITGQDTYVRLRHVFNQMRRDRPLRHPFERFATDKTITWVFPKPNTTARSDPMMRILGRIDCRATRHTGVPVPVRHQPHRKPGRHPQAQHPTKQHPKKQHPKKPDKKKPDKKPITRRTVIRIGMYAWFDDRGDALAKAVRHKWNQGCDVRVIYSVLNGKVKRILYDPSGRGRIPMRRSIVPDYLGAVVDYNHSKYVAVNGTFAGKGRRLVWTGSMNFTHLGLVSDDIIVRLAGTRVYGAYLKNFRRVWHAPTAKVPVPTRP